MCASIWSCSSEEAMGFSAFSVLSFCRNRHLLQLFSSPQYVAVKGGSRQFVNKVREELENRGCQIRTGCAVRSVSSTDGGCCVLGEDNSEEVFDGCIISIHAPDALEILGSETTHEESRILGAFRYMYSDAYLHHDTNLMPQNLSAWSAWNILKTVRSGVSLTYWLNVFQNFGKTTIPFLVTLNPHGLPRNAAFKLSMHYPVPSVATLKASLELDTIQGKRGIWYCGAYHGYGLHEDGLKAAKVTAHSVLGKEDKPMRTPAYMMPSLMEIGARFVVYRFLEHYISTGCLILLEEGGTIFVFKGIRERPCVKSVLKVHTPLFYWKIATQADLGLADAYINGHFSPVDEQEGLLDLFLIFIGNRDLRRSSTKSLNKRGGWWKPLLLTAGISSAKYFCRHLSKKNSLTQARYNISSHYDLSNDFFSLFLDETMQYSCAIFKTENEDLKIAQLRKVSLLIEKARIHSTHEILDIGCGWGGLAIQVVNQTGCRCTGITLSEEQLKFARRRVKDAGLEDKITILLCDYRQLPSFRRYDRIISCEMIEAVGHEYMDEFFSCCESLLAEDGLFVLQFSSIVDERYEEYRRNSDFIREYIFPGGHLPSLSRVTSAMAASSRLCVEHVENIGIHYYQTLRCWQANLMANKSEILALGFDEKFIRTWDYYFMYCAAGFKSLTLGNYQIVFSRPGNLKSLGDPYKSIPSVH